MTALVIRGDARHLPLPDQSVDLIVTSPPYFALRSYSDGGLHYHGQIGSEPTPQEFLEALWECTAEFMRVLKPSGSAFVNLGDKYSGNETGGALTAPGPGLTNPMGMQSQAQRRNPYRSGMRPKSLMLLPERYRIGCVDRLGLIARAVIVLDKKNGLPESVTDRVRRSHEDWVHLTKQPRYYSAIDEIREAHAEPSRSTGVLERHRKVGLGNGNRADGTQSRASTWGTEGRRVYDPLGKLPGSVWQIPTEPLTVPDHLGIDHFAAYPCEWPKRLIRGWSPSGICLECGEGRRPVADKRHVPTQGPNGVVSICVDRKDGRNPNGRPRADVSIVGYVCACTPHTDHPGTGEQLGGWRQPNQAAHHSTAQGISHNTAAAIRAETKPWRDYHFDRWTPAPTRPAIVLDPFMGTGTSVLVASSLGRIGIGVDLSFDYCRLAQWRTTDRGQIAKVLEVPKPPVIPETQTAFDFGDVS